MAFLVKNVLKDLPSSDFETSIKLFTYPKHQIQNAITSNLVLTHKDAMPKSFGGGGFLKFLTHQYTYFVVFTQIEKDEVILALLLHQGDDQRESETAFDQIHTTLKPLILNGTIKMNKPLLEEALLPTPLPPSDLSVHLVEIMESRPEIYPEWHKVVQALLHFAISGRKCRREEVHQLLSVGGDLVEEDIIGNTPLHSAASNVSAEGMEWLMDMAGEKVKSKEGRTKLLTRRNTYGECVVDIAMSSNNYSALSKVMKVGGLSAIFGDDDKPTDVLHTAVNNDSYESIRVIVEEKQTQRMKSRTLTNLRQKKTTKIGHDNKKDSELESVSSESDVSFNIADKDGNTPLMIAAKKGFIKSCQYLLLGEACPNFPNPITGDTTLHIAVENGHLSITKLLLIFKANPSLVNKKREKPIDKAPPTHQEKFRLLFKEITSLLESSRITLSKAIDPLPLPPDSICLLSCDGGGVRAILVEMMLVALENRMKELDPNCMSPIYYFDYISGTSAGAFPILFCLYSDFTLETALIWSLNEGVDLGGSSKRVEIMEDLAVSHLGTDAVMADIEHPRSIITTVLADRVPAQLHLVTNYGEARNGQKGPNERKVWEAVRMTSAAPAYFQPFEGKFIDGGLMANNPTLDAMAEIINQGKREGKPAKLGCVVSLGTGLSPAEYVDNVAITIPTLSFSSLLDISYNIAAVKNLASIVLEQVSKCDGEDVIKASAFCEALGSSYFRLNPPLESSINLTETDMTIIIDMMYQCRLYILRKMDIVDQIARLLLSRDPIEIPVFRGTTPV